MELLKNLPLFPAGTSVNGLYLFVYKITDWSNFGLRIALFSRKLVTQFVCQNANIVSQIGQHMVPCRTGFALEWGEHMVSYSENAHIE